MKSAEIVSVGEELLAGMIADTNAQFLGGILPELGILHRRRQTVGDDLPAIVSALNLALSRSDVVFTIGGLGPTEDDLTRLAIAEVMGVGLETDAAAIERLQALFRSRKIAWTERQARQAQKPTGAFFVENPNGTAPGLICPVRGKFIIALPGPRGEFQPMINGPVREFLSENIVGGAIASKVLRTCGIGEGLLERELGDLIDSKNPTIAPYAGLGEVKLRIVATAESQQSADALLLQFETLVRDKVGGHIYGEGSCELESAVLALLQSRDQTLGVCESMTGGGLAQRLTATPGASAAFVGGLVAYQLSTKTTLAGITDTSAPVSAEMAIKLAEAAREKLGSTYGVGITGNAGPTSDVGDKPVGLVYVAMSGPDGTTVEEHQFRGIREDIRRRATQVALLMLWRSVK
ncbi:MAG: competence/damage-inducible protein A [Fimbriimonadaceae bacterium]